MREVGYAQVRMWMEHLDEDCALEEQEEAVRGPVSYTHLDVYKRQIWWLRQESNL